MKRRFAFLLAILMLGLCACGGNTGSAQPETTEYVLPAGIMQKENPKEDDSMNVFFVSNSTCCYFPDELHGMLTAAGYKNVKLSVAYYSGCSIKQHNDWLKEDKRAYSVRVWDENGKQVIDNCSLKDALRQYNWDVITFDNNSWSFSSGDVEKSMKHVEPHFGELYGYLKEQFPLTRFLWHEMWANEIGYSISYEMKTVEQRTNVYNAQKGVAKLVHENYGLDVIPTGAAWEKVRDLPLFTTPIEGLGVERFTLCSRIRDGQFKDDFVHDGDMGGGQYLNACVFFEVLTGQSCIGNSFRPQYELLGIDCSLTEEKIQILQNTAHEAVAEFYK